MPTERRSPGCNGRVTFGVLLLSSFALLVVAVGVSRAVAKQPFSRWRWVVSSGMRSREMALDWLQSHFVKGMSVEEVLADLGEPSHTADSYWYDAGPNVPRTPGNLRGMNPGVYVWFTVHGTVRRVSGGDLGEGPARSSFDAGAWLESAGSDRRALALALVDEGLPESMRKDDVVALLGRPDSLRACEFRYLVEPSEALEFVVGPDGRIASAGIDSAGD
jgi:hypothetical protein